VRGGREEKQENERGKEMERGLAIGKDKWKERERQQGERGKRSEKEQKTSGREKIRAGKRVGRRKRQKWKEHA